MLIQRSYLFGIRHYDNAGLTLPYLLCLREKAKSLIIFKREHHFALGRFPFGKRAF
ncbi:hypothetical protein IX339_001900 [Porphyromonas levii]|nr:hypothetical protein [Porphyromonas levii]MBR8764646.1 hypothetical protein [Porphyromonas levii]MBR8807734.1 hypothetical protein [Porphyromonas levii]